VPFRRLLIQRGGRAQDSADVCAPNGGATARLWSPSARAGCISIAPLRIPFEIPIGKWLPRDGPKAVENGIEPTAP
jgi:hypothetical protein